MPQKYSKLLFLLTLLASGCGGEPAQRGMASIPRDFKGEEVKPSDEAQRRQLCAMHGDYNCREVLEGINGKDDDTTGWWDQVWYGVSRGVPESGPSHR